MEESEGLRSLACRWSLLADDKLLSALDKLHQKVLSSCMSSSERLECLAATVQRAEHSLTMLNDRFASLSNRQFVERRVYEDDADIQTDVQTDIQTNTQAQNKTCSPLSPNMTVAVNVITQCHDRQQLVDSDDSDDDVTCVLRLRDMYTERPLPNIIGTDKWRRHCFYTESQSESEVESSDDEEDYNDRHTHNTQNSLSIDSESLREEPYSTQQDLDEEIQSHTKIEDKLPYMPPPQPVYNPRPLIPRPEPEVFQTEPPEPEVESEGEESEQQEEDDSERKPIGGVSMFGTTKPSDIGAAILNRKRQDSTSGDESDLPVDKHTDKHNKQDIFDDLFAKSEKLHKNTNKETINTKLSINKTIKDDVKIDSNKNKQETKAKVDLFNDDFDDIDNIFTTTSNVTKESSNVVSNTKPVTNIFDDDDDDLDVFKDIAVKSKEINKVSKIETKGIFDSDDDELFGSVTKNTINSKKDTEISKKDDKIPKAVVIKTKEIPKSQPVKKTTSKFDQISKVKSIFDDSDDELFSDDIKPKILSKIQPNTKVNNVDNTKGLFDSDDELFTNIESVKTVEKSTLIQDNRVEIDKVQNKTEVLNVMKPDVMASPNLFDDEEELLFNESKLKKQTKSDLEVKIDQSIIVEDLKDVNNEITDNIEKNKADLDSNTKFQSPDIIENSQSDDIFNNPDDIFEKNQPKSEDIENDKTQQYTEILREDRDLNDSFNTNNEVIKPVNESNIKDDIKISENIESIVTKECKQDIFSDLFNDVPPEFEKPKEFKKSKNVNALFDDDSDDESLFFKKNDNFDDLPPESDKKDLFGLFLDEPPNIDVDFIKKDMNVPVQQKDTINTKDIRQKSDLTENKTDLKYIEHKNKFENLFDDDIFSPKVLKSDSPVTLPEAANDKSDSPIDNTVEKPEIKKIGKLKPLNINIDINSLKPGASLKKTIEQTDTDGQILAKSNEELHSVDIIKENIQTNIVKSVSFEGNVDTNVLDNKLSKERAKIQVKRKPSTRKARREAAKVSGIQFPSDLTDGSTNNDEIHKSDPVNIDVDKDNDKNIDDFVDINVTAVNKVNKIEELLKNNDDIFDTPKLDDNNKVNIKESEIEATVKDKLEETQSTEKDEILKTEETTKNVKSKVVYILNDEDIFDTKSETKIVEKVNNKVLNIIDDDDENDDLFKYMKTAGTSKNTEVNIEKDITENTQIQSKIPLFSSDSDDDIFKTEQNVTINKEIKNQTNIEPKKDMDKNIDLKKDNDKKKVKDKPKKKSLFDSSDSDEELFKPKSKKLTTKPSVFDSDSESELFGSKDTREAKKEKVANERKREKTLFDDDDDEDLFKNTSKGINSAEDPLQRL